MKKGPILGVYKIGKFNFVLMDMKKEFLPKRKKWKLNVTFVALVVSMSQMMGLMYFLNVMIVTILLEYIGMI